MSFIVLFMTSIDVFFVVPVPLYSNPSYYKFTLISLIFYIIDMVLSFFTGKIAIQFNKK